MSNKFNFWDGQPVTAPIYPQMGDIQQMTSSYAGYGGAGQWPGAAAAAAVSMHQQHQRQQTAGYSGGAGLTTRHMQGMGDFRQMSCPPAPLGSFFGQPHGHYEPCIDNSEAFSAYTGLNAGIRTDGTIAGRNGGADGDFW